MDRVAKSARTRAGAKTPAAHKARAPASANLRTVEQRLADALATAVDARIGAVHTDERKVKQVLLNLLSNALKFTPEGGRIDVRASLAHDVVEIAVTDTGVGIPPGDQATVFEEFRQVGAAAKKVEGTGLGLAISRKFVELHGGAIRVASKPGKGSTFTFTLPTEKGSGWRKGVRLDFPGAVAAGLTSTSGKIEPDPFSP